MIKVGDHTIAWREGMTISELLIEIDDRLESLAPGARLGVEIRDAKLLALAWVQAIVDVRALLETVELLDVSFHGWLPLGIISWITI